MRFLLVSCCLLLALAVPAETPLKVMSFNVRYGTAMDGDNHWNKRKDLLVETIREHSPDLLGVQECLVFQAEYIVEKLPEYRWIGIGRDRNGTGEMAAILYRHSDFVPVAYNSFWLSETPDEPGSKSWDSSITRIATHAKLFHPKSGKFLDYFNTHFDHKGAEARKQSAALLGSRIAALGDADPVIVTGDFNAIGDTSEPWKTLTSAGDLRDAWTATAERFGPVSTWCGFTDPNPDADNRIDWILFRNGVKVKRCETVVKSVNDRYPSDHFPVVADLVLPW